MSESIIPVKHALISVFDKQGLIELARVLAVAKAEIIASGKTRAALVSAGLDVTDVAEPTRPARDPGRPRQDASSQDPRRHPRPPRRADDLADARRGGVPSRSTSSW